MPVVLLCLLFCNCHFNRPDKPTSRRHHRSALDPKQLPGLPAGNFDPEDTLSPSTAIDTESYKVLNAFLAEKATYEVKITTLFCNEAKKDSLSTNWLNYFVKRKLFSPSDTLGLLHDDTSIYRIDWQKAGGRQGISLKQAYRSLSVFYHLRFAHGNEFAGTRRFFNKAFGYDNLVFISCPPV